MNADPNYRIVNANPGILNANPLLRILKANSEDLLALSYSWALNASAWGFECKPNNLPRAKLGRRERYLSFLFDLERGSIGSKEWLSQTEPNFQHINYNSRIKVKKFKPIRAFECPDRTSNWNDKNKSISAFHLLVLSIFEVGWAGRTGGPC